MCGIIGYIGQRPAGPIVLEGLSRLEYRGYDSAGIALLDRDGELYVAKATGKLDQLGSRVEGTLPPAVTGIGHTRWATHGEPNDANAHPHLDPDGRVAVVHNGIVENFEALRRRQQQRGAHFTSDTDTEVVAHMLAERMELGDDLAEAMGRVVAELEGAQALVAVSRDEPGRIVAARVGNAGGVVIGYGDGEHFIASDLAALLPHTRRVIFLDPGEIADVQADGVTYVDDAGRTLEKAVEQQPYDPVAAVKGRYRHFMLKEIHEQPDAALDALRGRYQPDPRVWSWKACRSARSRCGGCAASCWSAWAPRGTPRWSGGTTLSASLASPPRSTTPPSSATASRCSTAIRSCSPSRSPARRSTRCGRWSRRAAPAALS